MTMSYRNRRSTSNARAGEMSPTTGRIVVIVVGIGALTEAYLFNDWLFYVVGTLGTIGMWQAAFNPEIFGDG